MINIYKYEVRGLDWAIEGMRIPMESIGKSDSWGPRDMKLAKGLIGSGPDHRKFVRLIDCWISIKAPRYWWQEFDTYRNGVDKVSSSTMHLITKRELTLDDFVHNTESLSFLWKAIEELNIMVKRYNDIPKDNFYKRAVFEGLKQLLPESYLQQRVVKCSYEALMKMYKERKTHRLSEWKEFCLWIEDLPLMREFLNVEAKEEEPING